MNLNNYLNTNIILLKYKMSDNTIDTSYSVFLEQRCDNLYQEPLKHALPRKIYTWVSDDTVFTCQNNNCNSRFSFFNRKHHCRFCGKIFCATCINFMANIPQDLLSDDSKKGTWNEYIAAYIFFKDSSKQKVCEICKALIDFIDSIKKKIEVFRILSLDIEELKKSGIVCKEWQNASNYILSIFREIQYKLPNSEYSDYEKELLWNNMDYLSGHNKYLVHLIKICKTDIDYKETMEILNKKKQVTCWSMMCNRNCNDTINSFDAINLLCHSFKDIGHNDILRATALKYLMCSDRELKCYLPLLVYYLRYDNGTISEFLVKRCINNFELLNALYWELQLYPKDIYHENAYTDILNKLKEIFKESKHHANFVKILEGYQFVKLVENISKAICTDNKKYDEIKDIFNIKGTVTCPLNNEHTIQNIHIEKIKIKNSATKPMVIPCKSNKGLINILYKKEDVRKDQIIMNLIYIINSILKKDEKLDLDIVTYNILPTSQNSGLIEIIENSETVYSIQEKLQSSILNYILDNNEQATVKDIRNEFINSLAVYSVINYLFGIGDRHLDNIMITTSGKLFHIDYGYILGNDPISNNPGIRITPEMVDAIGGLSSKNYQKFTELCFKIYSCLRRNVDIFINMLTILPKISDLKMSSEDIRILLIKRFIPGETQVNANLHLVNQLEKQNYIDKIKDWCHYHSKEQTISSAMNRLTYAVANLVISNIPDDNKSTHNSTIKN